MDPLLNVCSSPISRDTIIELHYYQSNLKDITLQQPIRPINQVEDTILTDLDDSHYTIIRDIVDGINLPKNNNRAENKLKNLLAICPNLITNQFKSQWKVKDILKDCDLNWNIIDIASGPGSWSSLMLNRFPSCTITGYTLYNRIPSFRWYPFLLNNPRFTGIYGDVIAESLKPSSRSKLIQDDSYDLCLCDGGTDLEETDDLESRILFKLKLLAGELITCLSVGKVGSNAVIKIVKLDIVNTQHLVNLMGCAYERFTIVKLLTSRLLSSEFFLICLNRKSEVAEVISRIRTYLTATTRPSVTLDPKFKIVIDRILREVNARVDEARQQALKIGHIISDKEDYSRILGQIYGTGRWVVPSHSKLNSLQLRTLLKIKS
jgi:23S rRNA U2552 (ribose-2'-O)-methylase RlmE/FtsJ